MSGTMMGMSPLAMAMMGDQQQPGVGMQTAPGGVQFPRDVPLSSLFAPNAAALQAQNPNLPWYAVPGMFRPPGPPPSPAVAPPAAAAAPDATSQPMSYPIEFAGSQ